ncbi:Putative F-box/LRR-repeat protein At5g02930 [Linum perenne]
MVRRSKRIQNRIDWLSDLPDSILYHILSFVDTKSSVQTCILSRRWRSVWKSVDVLNLSKSSFRPNFEFEQYVDRVLSLRSADGRVCKVRTDFRGEQSMHLLDRVVKYAASHGVQELFIRHNYVRLLDVVESVCSCYQSLKVLELNQILLEQNVVGLWSRLELLESLTLTQCPFNFDLLAFANFPRLETLKLDRCFHYTEIQTSVLKVTGSRLLNLEIVFPEFYSLEIVCPKLQSFSLAIDPVYCTMVPYVCKSNLASLNRANIKFSKTWHVLPGMYSSCSEHVFDPQLFPERCANLFKMLHNVQALDLQVDTFELLIQAAKHQSSPRFKRIKSLNLKCYEGSTQVPDQVSRYFLGESPNEEDKRFTVDKLG